MEDEEEQETAVEEKDKDKDEVPNSLLDADKHSKDSSQHMELDVKEENLGPVSSVPENPEVIRPEHDMDENDAMLNASVPSHEELTLKKEEFPVKQEVLSPPKPSENLIPAEDGKNQGLNVDVENSGYLLQRKTFGGCSEPDCNSKASLSDVKDIDSRATKASSDTGKDAVTGIIPRDNFVEDADGGQNSQEKIMQSGMEPRVDVKQKQSRTRSLSPSAEIKDGNKRPAITCAFFAQGWCIRGSSCSFLHIKDSVNNTDQGVEGNLVTAHQKRELKLEKGVKENVDRSRTNDGEASPSWHSSREKEKFPMRDSLFPENRSAFNTSNNYFGSNLSSFSSREEGMAAIRNHHMYRGYTSREDFSSSLGASAWDSQKVLNSEKEYHAHKSTFSSGWEDLHLVGSSKVPPHANGYKQKTGSYDWEPSVPFRPSFFITSMNVSSPGDLYDPLRDSIEIPNIGDGSLKAFLIRGSSIQASSQVRTYDDSAAVGKHMSDHNDDKSSVSSHNKFYENEPNRSSVPRGNDSLATKTEITSGTCANYHNDNIDVGQHAFGVEDRMETAKKQTEHDVMHHGDGSEHIKKRIAMDNKIHEMEVDFSTDSSVHKETKALKFFRATLVDLVKELLKPFWHEGRVSKDAHVLIVKKSVDKVINTLEPHQIPITEDNAKQYVSSCRPKIAKLVQ
ncbi:hypothetical protein TSUD_386120, partial [Trifolium subterraneum]